MTGFSAHLNMRIGTYPVILVLCCRPCSESSLVHVKKKKKEKESEDGVNFSLVLCVNYIVN